MNVPSKRVLVLTILASLLSGVALAAYELDKLHRAMTASEKIADAVAGGLGGTRSQTTVTVTVSLFFGLIPVGRVDNPYLVMAVGDFILGTFITGFAIILVYSLCRAFRRTPPMGTHGGESRNV